MGRIAFLVPTFLAALGFLCDGVRAELLWLEFGGVITKVVDSANLVGIVPNTPFTGRFTYDPAAPDSAPDDPTLGNYGSPAFGMVLTMGPLDWSAGATVTVENGVYGFDRLIFESVQFALPIAALNECAVSFRDDSGTALAGDSLPILGHDLGLFQESVFNAIGVGEGERYILGGEVTWAAIVPEPSACGLLMLGGAWASRRSRGGRSRRLVFRWRRRTGAPGIASRLAGELAGMIAQDRPVNRAGGHPMSLGCIAAKASAKVGFTVRTGRLLVALWCISVPAVATRAEGATVRAAVLRSTGTYYPGMGIWSELNAGWNQFGDVPVQIDYTSLAGSGWTVEQIEATGADVLVLSNPAFWSYGESEIDAVRQYVESGHGLIISYGKFRYSDRALAPLVGLSSAIRLGTGTATHPIQIDPLLPRHPIFAGLTSPYVSGVRFNATPYPYSWLLDGGTVLAELFTEATPRRPGIIARDADTHRGLYFSYYIEDKVGGANIQDMQVFYNGLLWTASVPEPTSVCLGLIGAGAFLSRRGRRWFT